MPVSKKTFLVSSILLLVTLLLWGVYYLSFRSPAEQTSVSQPKTEADPKNDPAASAKPTEAKISPITEEAVLAPIFVNEDHTIKYYSKESGKAYQITSDGTNKKTLSSKDLPGLVAVVWSPDKTKVLTKFSRPNGQFQYFYYDFLAGKGVPLKSNLDFAIWQNNDKIFYKYYDPASRERSLNLADPDGTNWKKITALDLKDIFIAPVPQSGLVSFWTKPDAYTETSFRSISLVGTENKVLFTGKFGADYLWNNNGTKALISHADDKDKSKIRLATINSQGGEYKNLDIPTLVSKSVWSKDGKTVYYALPGSLPDNSILPNDYVSGKFTTADTFWKVDIATGKKSRTVELDKISGQFDVSDLFLNYDESMLFFINKTDGKLYRINL